MNTNRVIISFFNSFAAAINVYAGTHSFSYATAVFCGVNAIIIAIPQK